MKVTKADMNTNFYCEVSYFVPGGVKMMESERINITVLCRCQGLGFHLPGFYEVLHRKKIGELENCQTSRARGRVSTGSFCFPVNDNLGDPFRRLCYRQHR